MLRKFSIESFIHSSFLVSENEKFENNWIKDEMKGFDVEEEWIYSDGRVAVAQTMAKLLLLLFFFTF